MAAAERPRRENIVQYFDRRGRRLNRAVWAHLQHVTDYAHVLSDVVTVGDRVAHVHTFWLGLGTPAHRLLFRTVLARSQPPHLIWGWATESSAHAGHRAVCDWLAAKGPLPAGLVREREGPTSAPSDSGLADAG